MGEETERNSAGVMGEKFYQCLESEAIHNGQKKGCLTQHKSQISSWELQGLQEQGIIVAINGQDNGHACGLNTEMPL